MRMKEPIGEIMKGSVAAGRSEVNFVFAMLGLWSRRGSVRRIPTLERGNEKKQATSLLTNLLNLIYNHSY